jgi:hypothetical protein
MALIKMCHINRAVNAVLEEKKTADLSLLPKETPVLPLKPPSSPTSGNALPLGKDAVNTLSEALKSGVKKADKIPLSLHAFEQVVQVEQAALSQRKSLFSVENCKSSWADFASRTESPSLRQALLSAVLSLEDKVLVAKVGLSIQAGLIQAETTKILDFLRHHLQDIGVNLKVVFDETLVSEVETPRPVKVFSHRERLERIRSEYPLVNELLSRLDLRVMD